VMISLVAGSLLVKKIQIKSFLAIWVALGIISPLFLLSLNFAEIPITMLVAVLFGISLGLGIPSCMNNFIKLTEIKVRGRYSGLIIFLTCVGTVLLALINSGGILVTVLILVVWRLFGLAALPFQKFATENSEKPKTTEVSFSGILKQRSFILYLIPWLMFCLVNYLSIPVQDTVLGANQINILQTMEGAIIGVFAVASGFLIDYLGRKRVAIAGFVLIGVGYSVLGLYPKDMASWYFYTVADGLAWGIFYVMFVVLIWGDLSNDSKSEKYYAIGVLPFFISKFLELSLSNYVASSVSPYALFSFTGFFLFLAVLPLVYAPETLSEKTLKDRDLKSYAEKALKQAKKEADKKNIIRAEKVELGGKENDGETEKPPGYDKASKLAEKYY